MRKLQIYDEIENGKIYQFQSLHALDMFKRRSMPMSQMAHHVGMNPFYIVRVSKPSTDNDLHIQYQTEFHGAIRSAWIDRHAVAFLSVTPYDFVIGESYRTAACNKAYITTRYGQSLWDHVGVNPFVIDHMITVPNPNEGKLRLVTILNHQGVLKDFSMYVDDAPAFTSEKGFRLPGHIDFSGDSVRVKTLEIAPITNEKERLAAIKLLESIRYE